MNTTPKILVINPGSTSTKIAVFNGEKEIFAATIRHTADELSVFPTIMSQYEFRLNLIFDTLKNKGISPNDLQIVMGRGGLTYPLKSGVYVVCEQMLEHLKIGVMGHHASNLGAMLAYHIAQNINGAIACIADPVVTDEMQPVARIAGHPHFERISIMHALNQKAVARMYAKSINMKYDDLNLVVAHMGGGVSVGVHHRGKVIDVNNGLDGEGPFSPDRSGTLPVGQLIDACFSGDYTKAEIENMVVGNGGMMAYLHTNSMIDIEKMANSGNETAVLIFDAFIYQVAKFIGSMATVLDGNVDAIILTGGVAYGDIVIEKLKKKVEYISKVVVFPGEDEMAALAMNACMMFRGELKPQKYLHEK